MNKGYYITSKGTKHIIEPNTDCKLYLSYMDIIELTIPYGTKWIYCSNNQLKELIIPDTVEYIRCLRNNNLSNLILPESIRWVDCDIGVLDMTKYKDTNIDIILHI